MNNLMQYDFNGQSVNVILHDGDAWLDSETIGKALGYANPRDSILNIFNRNREELEPYSVTINLMATDGKSYETRIYNEEGTMMICFFSKQAIAADFRRWAVKILKAYRRGELESTFRQAQGALVDEVRISREQYQALTHAAEKMVLLEELRRMEKAHETPNTRVTQMATWVIELLEREAIRRGMSFPNYCAYILAEHAGELNRRRVG
ncbi:MAG TPA: hypothetical protein DIC36_07405 [Gammaproteobacteria bacterium]|nr:hypothetical protein [Gammaproteobacteria bacterium]